MTKPTLSPHYIKKLKRILKMNTLAKNIDTLNKSLIQLWR